MGGSKEWRRAKGGEGMLGRGGARGQLRPVGVEREDPVGATELRREMSVMELRELLHTLQTHHKLEDLQVNTMS